MIEQVNRLKALGYNMALQAWAEGEGFWLTIWKTGEVKSTSHFEIGDDPEQLFNYLLEKLEKSQDA